MLDAAKAMKLSSRDLLDLNVIDEIIPEPIGGAHRDRNLILENIRKSISKNLSDFSNFSPEEIINQRKNKFLKIGRNKGFMHNLEDLSSIKPDREGVTEVIKSKKFLISIIILISILSLSYYFF